MNTHLICISRILPGIFFAYSAIAQPTANFSATTVCFGVETAFTDESTPLSGEIQYYSWDFGDGTGSNIANPVHTYASANTYTVTLTIEDSNGDDDSYTSTVTVHPAADLDFSFPTASRCESVSQQFHNASSISSGTAGYEWNFGDGNTSLAPAPSHLYGSYGTYTVTLTATSDNNCVSSLSKDIVMLPEPTADFSFPGNTCLGEHVVFTNNSSIATGNLTYEWNFDDGSDLSTETNPSHTFTDAGVFAVTLTVRSVDGSCTDFITKQIEVFEMPQAAFRFSDHCFGEAALFTNESLIAAGTMTYQWIFGDGTQSTGQSPEHFFDSPGTYQVTLIAISDNGCEDEIVKFINVHPNPIALFEVDHVCIGDPAFFENLSSISSGTLSHKWTFGDGNTSTSENPTHTYLSAGVYNVQLEVTSPFNCIDIYGTTVQVFASSTGGLVGGSRTLCEDDDNSYFVDLSGHTGSVVRWEKSLTGVDQWSVINHAQTSLAYSGLQQTTWFRAIVKSGVCEEVASASARIQIDELSLGGTLMGSAAVCSGTNSTALELEGFRGTILDWEKSASESGPWTAIGNTDVSLFVENLTTTTYYRASVQSGVCNPVYSTIAKVEVSPPTIGGTVSGAATLCENDDVSYSLELSGHTGSVVRWEKSLTGADQWSAINHAQTSLAYSGLQQTTWFRAIVKSGVCEEEASASARIQIDELSLGGTLTGSTAVCSGTNSTTLELGGFRGTIQDWEKSASESGPWTGLTVSSASLTIDDLTTTTWYRVLVQNGVCGPVSSTVAKIEVYPETNAGLLTAPATVCYGDNTGQLTLAGQVGEVVRWEWSTTGTVPWSPIVHTGTTLAYENLLETTWYRVAVKSGVCGELISNEVKIQVDATTVAGTLGGPAEVCAGVNEGAILLEGQTGSVLRWQESVDGLNWADIANTTASRAFENLAGTTWYRAEVRNGVCLPAFTEAWEVKVHELPVVAFGSSEGCLGVSTVFGNSSSVPGGSVASQLWDFGDGSSSVSHAPVHTYQSHGTYPVKLTVTSSAGCIDSLTQAAVVNPNPVARFSQTHVCIGQPMGFSDLSTVAAGSITDYQWDLGDGNASLLSDLSHTYAADGAYTVTLSLATDKGCTDEVAKNVVVYPAPVAAFETNNVCFGAPTVFSNNSAISSGNMAYLWNFGDGSQSAQLNPSHEFAEFGSYIVNLQSISSFGCAAEQSQTIQVYEQPLAAFEFEDVCLDTEAVFTTTSTGAGLSYSWKFGDGGTAAIKDPTHAYKSPAAYHVSLEVVNDQGCASSASEVITIEPVPVISFAMKDVCLDAEVQFTNNSTVNAGAMDFRWLFGDGTSSEEANPSHQYASDGTYRAVLAGTTAFGCEAVLEKEVELYPLPATDFSAAPVCDGSPSEFVNESTINSGTITSWLWDFGDQSNAIVASPVKQYLNPGTYVASLLAESDKGCRTLVKREVVVWDVPVANFEVDNVCFGFEVAPQNLSKIASGSMTYGWELGDGFTSAAREPGHVYEAAGDYTITLAAISENNCRDTFARQVRVYEVPEVNAGADTTVSQGYSTQLIATGGVQYSWFPVAGLSSSSIATPVATPLVTTDYEVLVTDQHGCQNSDTVRVSVAEDFRIVASNVFTPDDNGQNDTWVINNVETFGNVNVRVYDRYGALIFQETAYQNDWRGMYGNDILPDGTYFYVITFSESEQKYQGALTIIRNR